MSDHNATGHSNLSRCYAEKAPENGPPLFHHGNVVFQAHHVGWIVASFFTIVATSVSLWLVNKHLQWYTNKREQRYIVRLLFLVPIYANISLASYLFWHHGTPLILIRDAYESTVLTSFFYLLLMYLSPDPDEQKAIFLEVGLSRTQARQSRKMKRRRHRNLSPELQPDPEIGKAAKAPKASKSLPKLLSRPANGTLQTKRDEGPKPVTRWLWPFGWVRWKPKDGLYFLWLMKWGVLQYCVIRPTTTLAAVILDYQGLYCEASLHPKWGHVWILSIISISVSIAMYCLIQLYMPIAWHLAKHRPLLKLFAVKAVVFLTFWQATLLSILALFGLVKDTRYMTAEEINIGFGALLETFEMTIFAFIHVKAFSYKPYRPPPNADPPPTKTPRLKSLANAMDFRETLREIVSGIVWMWDRAHGREGRTDRGVWREVHLAEAMGRRRSNLNARKGSRVMNKAIHHGSKENGYGAHVQGLPIADEEGEEVPGMRRWLEHNSHGYSAIGDRNYTLELTHERMRGMSDDLQDQIEKELERRGFTPHGSSQEQADVGNHSPARRGQWSWWRSIQDRLSRTGAGIDQTNGPYAAPSNYRTSSPSQEHQSRDRQSGLHSREMQSREMLPIRDDPRSLLFGQEGDIYDDPPPPSVIKTYQNSRRRQETPSSVIGDTGHHRSDTDVLTPLAVRDERAYQFREAALLAAPGQAALGRSDSLLGRVFPHGSSVATSTVHGDESVLSGSDSLFRPSRVTPRANLLPAPEVVSNEVKEYHSGFGEDVRGRNRLYVSTSAGEPEQRDELTSRPSHRRESAFIQPLPPPRHSGVNSESQSPAAQSGEFGHLASADAADEDFSPMPSSHRREAAHEQHRVFLVPKSPRPTSPERGHVMHARTTPADVHLPVGTHRVQHAGEAPVQGRAATLVSPSAAEFARFSRTTGPVPDTFAVPFVQSQGRSATLPAPGADPTYSHHRPRQPTALRPTRRLSTQQSGTPHMPTTSHRRTSSHSRRHGDQGYSSPGVGHNPTARRAHNRIARVPAPILPESLVPSSPPSPPSAFRDDNSRYPSAHMLSLPSPRSTPQHRGFGPTR